MSVSADTASKPHEQGDDTGAALALHSGHLSLLTTLREALRSEVGGEVVVKYEMHTARIYVLKGHVVWATASTIPRTLGRQLIDSKLLSEADLSAVVAECKRTGANFAETVVGWGLLDMESIRGVLLKHVAEGLLQPFSWPSLVTMFVPSNRPYAGSLTFDIGEALRAAAGLDKAGRTALPWLVSRMGEKNALEALSAIVEAQRNQLKPPAVAPMTPVVPAAPVAPAAPAREDTQAKAAVERVGEQLSKLQCLDSSRMAGVVALESGVHLMTKEAQEPAPDVLARSARELLTSILKQLKPGGWEPSDVIVETPRGSLLLHPIEVKPLGYMGIFVLVGPETRCSLIRLQLDRIMPDILSTQS
jgi:hypothetical protein